VVSRGGGFDRWDLQIRSGLFGEVRLLMAIEEHGEGKQLIRFRSWPWCSSGGWAIVTVLGCLAMGAISDGSRFTGLLLGAMALWPFRRTILECGTANSVVVRGLERLWPERE